MTMLSGLTSMFTQPAFQAIAAGLLTGAVAGTALVGSGILPLEPQREDPKFVALLACPGGGPELARVPAGQQLLITGRSEDGAWLEVYIGEPGVEFAWAPAPALRASSALDALPVSQCDTSQTFLPTLGPPDPTEVPPTGVPATVLPTIAPTPGPTLAPGVSPTPTPRVTASPTPKPTPSKTPTPTAVPPPSPTADPTPVPTPTKDPFPPSVSGLTASIHCTISAPVTISANVTDGDDPGANLIVTIQVSPQGVPSYSGAMSYQGGSLFQYVITPNQPTPGWASGQVAYSITALDNSGNTTTVASVNDFNHPSYLGYDPNFCGF